MSISIAQISKVGLEAHMGEAPLSSVPYLHIPLFKITKYADIACVERVPSSVLTPLKPDYQKKTRGTVTTFSRRSRKRMLESLAKIRQGDEKMKFCTLTYRDEEYFGLGMNPSDFQSHLDDIMTYIMREYPSAGIIWRKEFVDRKSGDYVGQIAPHAHLIITGMSISDEVLHENLSRWWAAITGASKRDACPRIDVQTARNRRHAYFYLSKYVAKVSDESLISEFFHNEENHIGRHWGTRGNLNMSEGASIVITGDELVILKRLIRSWLKSKKKHRFAKIMSKNSSENGCSIFGMGDTSEGDPLLLDKMLEHVRSVLLL